MVGSTAFSGNNLNSSENKIFDNNTSFNKGKVKDSRKFFADARGQTQMQPAFLITDGRHPLTKSIQKEMPETNHVRLVSLMDKRNNNQGIERLNGTVRDRVKTMRGFDNIKTAELMTSAYRNYYNFIKPHSSIGGLTPALKAKIGVDLKGNKWMTLLKKSFENQPQCNKEAKIC